MKAEGRRPRKGSGPSSRLAAPARRAGRGFRPGGDTSEGTVEAVFEGAPDDVERLVSFAKTGPPDAGVETVDVHEDEPEGLSGFAIR